MLMLPSLVRLFGASENPVNLVPRSEADSDMAEQATSYVNYVFWNDNPGFLQPLWCDQEQCVDRSHGLSQVVERGREGGQAQAFPPIFLSSSCRCYWRKTRPPRWWIVANRLSKMPLRSRQIWRGAALRSTPPMGAPPQPPTAPPMAAPGQSPSVPERWPAFSVRR